MRDRNRELFQLSGTLAHEVKNPLASIQGLAGLLARKAEEGSKEAEQFDVLLGEVRRRFGRPEKLAGTARSDSHT